MARTSNLFSFSTSCRGSPRPEWRVIERGNLLQAPQVLLVPSSSSPPSVRCKRVPICTRFRPRGHHPSAQALVQSVARVGEGLLLIMTVVFIISRNDLLTEKGIPFPRIGAGKNPRRDGRNALTTLKSCRNKNEISRGGGIIIVIHPPKSTVIPERRQRQRRGVLGISSFRIVAVGRIYLHRGFGRLLKVARIGGEGGWEI